MGKGLILSHTLFLAAGFALGKYVDYQELAFYREQHESGISKLRRRLGSAALGVGALGTLLVVLKVSSRSTSSSSTS